MQSGIDLHSFHTTLATNGSKLSEIYSFFVGKSLVFVKCNMANKVYNREDVLDLVSADSGDEKSDSDDEFVADFEHDFGEDITLPQMRTNAPAHEREPLLSLDEELNEFNVRGISVDTKKTMAHHQKAPATSVHCGYEPKKAAVIIRCQALREQDAQKKSDIDNLLQLYDAEWHDRISRPALDNLALKKHNTPQLLPITEEFLSVRKHVTEQIEQLTKKVTDDVTAERWRKLAEVCLTRLIMFNKRRGGEVTRMKLSTFEQQRNWNRVHNKEILESLSSSERGSFVNDLIWW
ncbi:uncharacterized protein LOC114536789 isoform X2 [Dendronephthya gigantea]|uniref:uncharacterized protein LOC114536789 isoform X2 n=1 Tax=Dendronephthya gigantea TaxID=151771 RepID=UPI00106BB0B5|nr:uncharacterized protein LOC114536789 isoform X2 [Dendronephthya gigantea]